MEPLANFNLNRLLVFVTVVDAGSLTAAAVRLGLTKTVVSAHIRKLEQETGASLLLRTTRSLSLTDAGEAFYEASRRIVHDAADAVAEAGQAAMAPRGLLRVTAPIDYCGPVVAVAAQLRQRYPELDIELLSGDGLADLVKEGIDVAVRIGRLRDSALQAARLAEFEEWVVAPPQLFKAMPESPASLEGAPFVGLSVLPKPWSWTFTRGGEQHAVKLRQGFACNSALAVLGAVLHGAGFCILPHHVVEAHVRAGLLVRLLPEWTLPGGGVHAVFPATRYRPKKTRVFVDALREQLAHGVR
ncbi:LysR family transcriptional regulator [Pseudoduganella ginsengisoli]|uniref:LysR family transcriptional regulator n=1 Tax=Pseudoduganella ginsengisoli TaxID=1462440 RepID=A0A6L6Q8K6_9BURK|nr:LysR family transcriptional regulator [Pseudoduganella ginsengisoli]MTW05581.1 LysR family transcriptional regulator [Pseudoduganella ginsengisoli]